MFPLLENRSYVTNVPKFLDIECNDQRSMQAFLRELDDIYIYIYIYNKLEQSVDCNPQDNLLNRCATELSFGSDICSLLILMIY